MFKINLVLLMFKFVFQVAQYKRTVNRIDNGVKLCDDLLAFIKERAIIEENYNKHLRQWSAKFRKA